MAQGSSEVQEGVSRASELELWQQKRGVGMCHVAGFDRGRRDQELGNMGGLQDPEKARHRPTLEPPERSEAR